MGGSVIVGAPRVSDSDNQYNITEHYIIQYNFLTIDFYITNTEVARSAERLHSLSKDCIQLANSIMKGTLKMAVTCPWSYTSRTAKAGWGQSANITFRYTKVKSMPLKISPLYCGVYGKLLVVWQNRGW